MLSIGGQVAIEKCDAPLASPAGAGAAATTATSAGAGAGASASASAATSSGSFVDEATSRALRELLEKDDGGDDGDEDGKEKEVGSGDGGGGGGGGRGGGQQHAKVDMLVISGREYGASGNARESDAVFIRATSSDDALPARCSYEGPIPYCQVGASIASLYPTGSKTCSLPTHAPAPARTQPCDVGSASGPSRLAAAAAAWLYC